MPELRQNYFTKEWVIIATERAKRPEELVSRRVPKTAPQHVENCPFCPGNESKTPPEVLRIPAEGNGAWQVRVIGNKFAALSPDIKPTRVIHRSRRSMDPRHSPLAAKHGRVRDSRRHRREPKSCARYVPDGGLSCRRRAASL